MRNFAASMLKERENKYLDAILTGFYYFGTPFSDLRFGNNLGRRITDSRFRLRGVELREMEPSVLEGLCYLAGGVVGLSLVPVDAVMTIYNSFRDRRKRKISNQ